MSNKNDISFAISQIGEFPETSSGEDSFGSVAFDTKSEYTPEKISFAKRPPRQQIQIPDNFKKSPRQTLKTPVVRRFQPTSVKPKSNVSETNQSRSPGQQNQLLVENRPNQVFSFDHVSQKNFSHVKSENESIPKITQTENDQQTKLIDNNLESNEELAVSKIDNQSKSNNPKENFQNN